MLTIKAFSRRVKPTEYFFICECSCGNKKEVRLSNLKLGSTISCGCFGKEQRRIANSGNTRSRKAVGESAINSLLLKYKDAAKKRNIIFSLSVNDFSSLISQNCFYCDTPPIKVHHKHTYYGGIKWNGIDRVDNSKEYILSNCVPCCSSCNSKKNSITIDMVKKIYEFINQ